MFYIDQNKCVGCGTCADNCPQRAISIEDDVAVINEYRCSQCGYCVSLCPINAIYETTLVHSEQKKEVTTMSYGRGFGFRGTSPPWPYVGRGRGGLPRCQYYGGVAAPANTPAFYGRYPGWGPVSISPQMGREQELGFLKEEANALRRQQEEIETRIKELEAKEQ